MKALNKSVFVMGLCGLMLAGGLRGSEFTSPAEWRMVNTNAVNQWMVERQAQASTSLLVWRGVAADVAKQEVRLLAEAVGHRSGITAEFLLVGPNSDRAYEAAAVTVAQPGDIVRAVESLGVKRGGSVGSRSFRFWPVGERMSVCVRRIDVEGDAERPMRSLINDQEPDEPLLGEGGVVFTGGVWDGDVCLTDAQIPCSIISLYNEKGTIFDVPFKVGQGEVYGRLALAETLPYGALLEVVIKPLTPADGQPLVLPLSIDVVLQEGGDFTVTCSGDGKVLKKGDLPDSLLWLKAQQGAGREPFVTLSIDEATPLKKAVEVASVFVMLDGVGLKLDGKPEGGLYARAFTPMEKWREREGRVPQPYELHVRRGEGGGLEKKLVFVEEDWTVPGLDPALTPREHPFSEWAELPELVAKTGGPECKVRMLFVYAPADEPLSAFMPGVRLMAERLPLVYVFSGE
ncbi:MAG: hypothetical protein PHU80_00310 [Kiritimatiellae bacterium]|nr:hypothetical protein [Kiritimatiellia bacterium]